MPMAKSPDLEVQQGGRWVLITVAEALRTNQRHGRCPECHGPVRAHKKGKNGQAAHCEHRAWNKACSRRDRSYGKP